MNTEHDFHPDDEDLGPSKSQRKRDMHALQKLGQALVDLSPNRRAKLTLPEELDEAIEQMHRIHKNEARRRHLQFIGKLMRHVDSDAIARQLDDINNHQQAQQHIAEQWRERLLNQETNALPDFIDSYPGVDIQWLRQTIRQAKKEASQNKPASHSRKLLRYLRETLT